MRWIAHSPMSVWNPVNQMAQELDRWFAPESRADSCEGGRFPLGINHNEAGLELVAELPGVSPDRLGISVDGDVLELKVAEVEPPESEEDESQATSRRSRYDAGRVRRIQIPEGIDAEGVQANLKYGVLTVQLPRVAKPEPKQVSVQVNEA